MNTPINTETTFTPIEKISTEDLLKYLLKEGSKTTDELFIEIKERFWSREDFIAYLNKP